MQSQKPNRRRRLPSEGSFPRIPSSMLPLLLLASALVTQRCAAEEEPPNLRRNRQEKVGTKIVGGTAVTNKNKYPYFLEWEDNRCGASLIWGGTCLFTVPFLEGHACL